jgi:hypothetical protein
MNPCRGAATYQDQCGTAGACSNLRRGDRNIDLQPRDCQAAGKPKPVELTMGVSPEVVFEYLETVIWVEWRRVARGADGA